MAAGPAAGRPAARCARLAGRQRLVECRDVLRRAHGEQEQPRRPARGASSWWTAPAAATAPACPPEHVDAAGEHRPGRRQRSRRGERVAASVPAARSSSIGVLGASARAPRARRSAGRRRRPSVRTGSSACAAPRAARARGRPGRRSAAARMAGTPRERLVLGQLVRRSASARRCSAWLWACSCTEPVAARQSSDAPSSSREVSSSNQLAEAGRSIMARHRRIAPGRRRAAAQLAAGRAPSGRGRRPPPRATADAAGTGAASRGERALQLARCRPGRRLAQRCVADHREQSPLAARARPAWPPRPERLPVAEPCAGHVAVGASKPAAQRRERRARERRRRAARVRGPRSGRARGRRASRPARGRRARASAAPAGR